MESFMGNPIELYGKIEPVIAGKNYGIVGFFSFELKCLESVKKKGYNKIEYNIKLLNDFGNATATQIFFSSKERDQALKQLANGETMIGGT